MMGEAYRNITAQAGFMEKSARASAAIAGNRNYDELREKVLLVL